MVRRLSNMLPRGSALAVRPGFPQIFSGPHHNALVEECLHTSPSSVFLAPSLDWVF